VQRQPDVAGRVELLVERDWVLVILFQRELVVERQLFVRFELIVRIELVIVRLRLVVLELESFVLFASGDGGWIARAPRLGALKVSDHHVRSGR
jgi:hypothetical protein